MGGSGFPFDLKVLNSFSIVTTNPEPVRSGIPEAQSIGHGKVLPPNTRDGDTIRT